MAVWVLSGAPAARFAHQAMVHMIYCLYILYAYGCSSIDIVCWIKQPSYPYPLVINYLWYTLNSTWKTDLQWPVWRNIRTWNLIPLFVQCVSMRCSTSHHHSYHPTGQKGRSAPDCSRKCRCAVFQSPACTSKEPWFHKAPPRNVGMFLATF